MIIQIRGTSGSGKTHLARRIMELYDQKLPIKVEKRRQPLGYHFNRWAAADGAYPTLFVPGHYETACGGCDTISTGFDYIFKLVRGAAKSGCDVMFEGLLLNSDANRLIELSNDYPGELVVIDLDTDIDECIASINKRRWAKNPDKPPVKEANTRAKHRLCERLRVRLGEAGVNVLHLNRDAAFVTIKDLLSL